MTPNITRCDRQRIRAFLNDELAADDIAEFEEHLSICSDCHTELDQQTADERFWTDTESFLRGAESEPGLGDTSRTAGQTRESDGASTPATGAGWNRLSFLDPTDDPHMMGRFGGYEISGIIGRGGMGIVMKGWDVSLDRFVAIKVLNADYSCQSASRRRFAREARAAAAVLHDNVIAIYGVDQWHEMPYLVMPYIKGESLQQRIDRSAPMSLEEILEISLQIARGLAAAHGQGLVHRDIKPANILMPASVSRVIITDFGLARTVDDASLTRSGVLAGTPLYMSPEQAKSDPIDGRADLFSLGSVMYAMACGRPPFRADTPFSILRKITDQRHRPINQVRDEMPSWFAKLIDGLLEKNPANRFQSASDVADQLEELLAHVRQPATVELPKLQLPRQNWLRRNRVAAGVTMFALSLLIAFAIWERSPVDPPERVPTNLEPPVTSSAPSTFSQQAPPSMTRNAWDANVEGLPSWRFDDSALTEIESEAASLLQETHFVPDLEPQSAP